MSAVQGYYAPPTVSRRAALASASIWRHPITIKEQYDGEPCDFLLWMTRHRFEGALEVAEGEDEVWLAYLRDAFDLCRYQSIGFDLTRLVETYPLYIRPAEAA